MKEVLHYLLGNIVSNPDSISISEHEEDSVVTLEVDMDEEDKGVVIGKGGMNIKSIRNIISIIARREGKKVYVRITD